MESKQIVITMTPCPEYGDKSVMFKAEAGGYEMSKVFEWGITKVEQLTMVMNDLRNDLNKLGIPADVPFIKLEA